MDEKPFHALRKESGSLIATGDRIFGASPFLRHRDIAVIAAHYADKKTLTAIDVGAFLEGRAELVNVNVIAIRQEDTDLRDMVHTAIAEIIADGTYKKINDKYFSFDVYGS